MSTLLAGRSLRSGGFLLVAVALGCGIQREGEGGELGVDAAGSGGHDPTAGSGGSGVAGVFGLGGANNGGTMSGSAGAGGSSGSSGDGGSPNGGSGAGGDAGSSGGPIEAGTREGGDASNDALAADASVTDAINDVVIDVGRDADAASRDVGADIEASVPDAKPDVCVSSNEVCDGLDNNCNGSVDEQNACPSGCIGVAHLGKGYMFCYAQARQASWPDAQADCVSRGMHLVRVDNATENQWLIDAMTAAGGDESIWIGANDRQTDGVWVWIDGSQFWQGTGNTGGPIGGLYNGWDVGQPNNNAVGGEACAELQLSNGTWNDLGCDNFTRTYVCEK